MVTRMLAVALGLVLSGAVAAQAQTVSGSSAPDKGVEDGGYYLAVETSMEFAAAKERVLELLKAEGFGLLTEVDLQAKMKEKLDVDLPPHVILGVCNPPAAYQAIQTEDWISTMMPCAVVVKQLEDGTVMVGAQNPGMLPVATGNDELAELGAELKAKMEKVLEQLAG